MKILYKRLMLLIFTIVLFFIIAEIACRFSSSLPETISDEHIYFIYKPNSTWIKRNLEYGNMITHEINTEGFLERNFPIEKDNNTYRIVVLGDSFTENEQIPQADSWPRILEDRLNSVYNGSKKFEVIKFARGGSGTIQEKLFYEYKARKYKPDMVILAFHNNDIEDNLNFEIVRKNMGISQTIRQSCFLKFLRVKILGVFYSSNEIPFAFYFFSTTFDNETEYSYQYEKDLIFNLKKDVENEGSKFLMIYLPAYFEVNNTFFNEQIVYYLNADKYDWYTKLIEKKLLNFSNQNNIDFFSLIDDIKKMQESSDKRLYGVLDSHWNIDGNKVAEILYMNMLKINFLNIQVYFSKFFPNNFKISPYQKPIVLISPL